MKIKTLAATLASLAVLSGPPAAQAQTPGAAATAKAAPLETPHDLFEPFNRAIFGFNNIVVDYVVDPTAHLLGAATPPFVTFISTDPKDRRVLKQNVFGDYAGVEQPAWNPKTRKFYANLTATNADPNLGGVAVIDPKTLTVDRIFPLTGCNPAGLAVGPRLDLLVGCSLTAYSQVISAADGSVQASVAEVAGSDEVWFNKGDGHYYLAARSNDPAKGGPSLGIIDARDNSFVANVPTDASAHSVAADARTGLVYVPLGPIPDCPAGCIGIYGPDRGHEVAER